MTKSKQLDTFFSPREIAQRLGISEKSVRRKIVSGELRVHRFGRQLRIAQVDLDTFIALCRR